MTERPPTTIEPMIQLDEKRLDQLTEELDRATSFDDLKSAVIKLIDLCTRVRPKYDHDSEGAFLDTASVGAQARMHLAISKKKLEMMGESDPRVNEIMKKIEEILPGEVPEGMSRNFVQICKDAGIDPSIGFFIPHEEMEDLEVQLNDQEPETVRRLISDTVFGPFGERLIDPEPEGFKRFIGDYMSRVKMIKAYPMAHGHLYPFNLPDEMEGEDDDAYKALERMVLVECQKFGYPIIDLD